MNLVIPLPALGQILFHISAPLDPPQRRPLRHLLSPSLLSGIQRQKLSTALPSRVIGRPRDCSPHFQAKALSGFSTEDLRRRTHL